ncbi:MAG: poly-gamma-glutamate biosynthesis protein PgsC/CapC [Nitrosomonas sp.]|nr:poly-gamma-glutamate biosynthesis protein PgsC/CapC [Nitrosomonas sp.]
MFDLFPLYIFPEGSLSASVITTVWVGVLVVAFFNLRLGWMLTGLVVPGYIVPLLIAKPWAASVVLMEGVITYFLVWLCTDFSSRWGRWSNIFGRDRFFALLLVSVAVRITMDGWLWPIFGEIINNEFGIQFDYRNNLHSFGLIVVALVANQFWKTGLVYGGTSLLITLGTTFFLVRYGLMELTNFNLSSLSYMYEDNATSMLASPKSYIILITTAFLASRMNLHYGWDFNGILIPALFAMQWYQPLKIATSLLEAFVILGVSTFLLSLPIFKRITMEGGRKLLLFFNVSFAYKMILGYVLVWYMPEIKVTDAFGFGYLLATLVAIKMHEKDIAARLSRALLQTSLTAVFFASLIGFSLTFLPQLWTWQAAESQRYTNTIAAITQPALQLNDVMGQDKVNMYRHRVDDNILVPLPQPHEIVEFVKAVQLLTAYSQDNDAHQLSDARALLDKIGYRVDLVEETYLYIQELLPRRGWGSYIINLQAESELVVEVPAPLDERGTMEAGARIFTTMHAKALAVAGSYRRINIDGTSDVLANHLTLFHAFHRTMARNDVVQIRGYDRERTRESGGLWRQQVSLESAHLPSVMWVKNALPPGLKLGLLRSWVGGLSLEWGSTPFTNLQRDVTRTGFAELVLDQKHLRKILFRSLISESEIIVQEHTQRIDGYLQDWLLSSKSGIADSGTNLYVPPKLEELLFLDEEVLTPLLRLISTEFNHDGWSTAGKEELRTVDSAARVMGYQIIQYRHKESGQNYLLLSEQEDLLKRRYWGSYVFRLGASYPYVVQVPRPNFEINSFEYGVSLFETLKAKAIYIAGASPNTNLDKSADLIRSENKLNVFNLVNQVVMRESHEERLLVVQSRAFAIRPEVAAPTVDALLAVDSGALTKEALSPLQQSLLKQIEHHGLRSRVVDGSLETAGYEVGYSPQAQYLKQSANNEFAILWLSPLIRANFQQQTENRLIFSHFNTLEINSYELALFSKLAYESTLTDSRQIPSALRTKLSAYIESPNIVTLSIIVSTWSDYKFERLIDTDSKQAFLLIYLPTGELALVVNLMPMQLDKKKEIGTRSIVRPEVMDFIETRGAWLEFRGNDGET